MPTTQTSSEVPVVIDWEVNVSALDDAFFQPFNEFVLSDAPEKIQAGDMVQDAMERLRFAISSSPRSTTSSDLWSTVRKEAPPHYTGVMGGHQPTVGANLGTAVDVIIARVPDLLAQHSHLTPYAFATFLAESLSRQEQMTPDVALAMLIVAGILCSAQQLMNARGKPSSPAPEGNAAKPKPADAAKDPYEELVQFLLFSYSSAEFQILTRATCFQDLWLEPPNQEATHLEKVIWFTDALNRRGRINNDLVDVLASSRPNLTTRLDRLRQAVS